MTPKVNPAKVRKGKDQGLNRALRLAEEPGRGWEDLECEVQPDSVSGGWGRI